jgi:hypothetical protein
MQDKLHSSWQAFLFPEGHTAHVDQELITSGNSKDNHHKVNSLKVLQKVLQAVQELPACFITTKWCFQDICPRIEQESPQNSTTFCVDKKTLSKHQPDWNIISLENMSHCVKSDQ